MAFWGFLGEFQENWRDMNGQIDERKVSLTARAVASPRRCVSNILWAD